MATAGGGGIVKGTSSREDTAKSTVTEKISQAVQSTSNLLHLMQQSSPSQVLEQMPRVISLLDAHIDNGLQRLKSFAALLFKISTCFSGL
ncbi:hypothetical protein REPUB_Repub08aG0218300 [Reevesia pubescens]